MRLLEIGDRDNISHSLIQLLDNFLLKYMYFSKDPFCIAIIPIEW